MRGAFSLFNGEKSYRSRRLCGILVNSVTFVKGCKSLQGNRITHSNPADVSTESDSYHWNAFRQD